ncbi:MAG: MGMT family protein [Elusimicrobiota bacterium]|jgi:O-6-methylguanine DNA methyltransferase|nr:MGMT family protein [Elusimicrobiota bacterium]
MKTIPKEILKEMEKYSEFYKKVWKECFKIAPGKILTYGELAKKIGNKNAARAVGMALGKNPFAPIIPCHRVIRKDGKLGGYSARGGIKLKKKMLDYEKTTGKDYKNQ